MNRDIKKTVSWMVGVFTALALAITGVALYHRRTPPVDEAAGPDTHVAPPPQVPGPAVNRWKEAARRVEEERGERIGRGARVSVPPQLLHYADKRRFLAVQVAGWREQQYALPHDEAGIAELIQKGELVEVKPVSDDYLLYGVGANASDEPLTHFDRRTGREFTLYPRWDFFDDERAAKQAAIEERKAAAAAKRDDLRKIVGRTRAARARRNAINKEIRAAQAGVAALQRRVAGDAAAWDDYDRRRMLVGEWQVLEERARQFAPRGYDLGRPGDRRAFRARLLSFIRPEALAVMLDIARQYREKFGRPLAFTSLVRSEHYQLQLGETNANATKIAVAPHTTGLAFDIYYHYMTADEQHWIMGLIAQMESDGRLEALRENRDHFHVFAFAQGHRPPERLIAEALGDVRAVRVAQAASAPEEAPAVAARRNLAPAAARKKAAAPRRRAAPAPKKRVARKPAVRRRR